MSKADTARGQGITQLLQGARVVELKFFGGLTDREAALVMNILVARLRRDGEFARSWLRQRLKTFG